MGKVSTSMTIDHAGGLIFLGALPEAGLFSRAAHPCWTLNSPGLPRSVCGSRVPLDHYRDIKCMAGISSKGFTRTSNLSRESYRGLTE